MFKNLLYIKILVKFKCLQLRDLRTLNGILKTTFEIRHNRRLMQWNKCGLLYV